MSGSDTGWGWVGGKKFHWFGADGRSLCGKWMNFRAELEQGMDDHRDNCAECKKRKAKESALAATEPAPPETEGER